MTSAYWQCGKCGTLQAKHAERRRLAETYIEGGEPALGAEKCSSCGARAEADDVYRGKLDPPQSDAFIARILAHPKAAQWNTVLKVWTRKTPLAPGAVVVFSLDPATVAHYRANASPLQLAAVALAKTGPEPDLTTDDDGLVVPGERLKVDFPSWRVWLADNGELWVTKTRVSWEEYPDTAIPERLKQSGCAGPVPAVPYLVGLCMSAGLDPNKLSPVEIRSLDERAARDA
jgi:hypothetical protein